MQKMSTYDKLYNLFESRVKGDCSKKVTRTLISPLLVFFEMYEKERCADHRQTLFQEVCEGTQFQWFHWAVDDHYGGVGEWREFPPVCVAQLNKAIRENQTSVRLTLSQRTYLIDFNEMTKRLVPDQNQTGLHPLHHSSVPVFVKADFRESFDMEKLIQLEKQLSTATERHRSIMRGILKLIKSSSVQPLDTELACAALTLLLRLASFDGMTEEFLNNGGVQALLQMRHAGMQSIVNGGAATTGPALNVLVTLILRQCVESDPDILLAIFEQTIRATCNGQPISLLELTSRRHAMRAKRYQKDWKRVFRLLTPLAVRAPAIFVEAIKNSLVIKKNELQFKNQAENSSGKIANEAQPILSKNVQTVLKQIVAELFQFENESASRHDRLVQPANLLKFIAEVLSSYPSTCIPVFVELAQDGHSVLKCIMEKFILFTGANANSDVGSENAHWAKAVLTELVSNAPNQRITDQLIGDIKDLVYVAYEETSKEMCTLTKMADKNKETAKLADRITALIKLTHHLRGCIQANTQNAAKQSSLLVKSIHKKNLANDFVKTLWSVPLHEKQGTEMVNCLLKLLEGMSTKNAAANEWRTTNPDHPQYHPLAARRTAANRAADEIPAGELVEQSEIGNVGDHVTADAQAENEAVDANLHPSEGGAMRGNHMDQEDAQLADISMLDSEQNHEENLEDEEDAHEEEDVEDSEDETPPGSDEDDDGMDTAEEMVHQQEEPEPHEGAMEDDHVSEAANEINDHAPHANLADDELEEMDGDDDDDEDEEDEEEDEVGFEGEAMADFEDALEDYMDMTNLGEIAQEVRTIGHDIRRINMNINAVAAHQLQALANHLPRNIRAMIAHHPRGGAVLRIRGGDAHANFPRNLLDFDRMVANALGGGAMAARVQRGDMELISTLTGWDQAVTGTVMTSETSPEERLVPCFLDRMADWCRIMDSQSIFKLGTITSSYLVSAIQAPADPPAPEKHDEEKSKDPSAVEATQQEAMVPLQEIPENPSADGPTVAVGQPPVIQEQHLGNQEAETTMPVQAPTTVAATDQQPQQESSSANTEAQQQETRVVTIDTPEPTPMDQQSQQESSSTNTEFQQETGVVTTDTPEPTPMPRGDVVEQTGLPEGVDPAFLAALPEEMRQEVIRDHLLQQQMNQPTEATSAQQQQNQELPPERIAAIMGMQIPEGMDPAFLAALPEDIFNEVVRDHQRQQELARQRQAQQQAAAQAAAHHYAHQHHHRHFAMPRFMTHRGGATRVPGAEGPSTTGTQSTERSVQFLDRESICTLLLLYMIDQEKLDFVRLQKVIKLICMHPATCDFTICALLSMFDGLDKFGQLENTDGTESGKFQSGWVNELRLQSALYRHERVLHITPGRVFINQQVRSSAAHRIVDTLTFLTRSFGRNFLPKPIRQGAGKTEQPPTISVFWNIIRSINGKRMEEVRKEGSRSSAGLHEIVADSVEKSPLAQLFKLVESSMSKDNHPLRDKFLRIIFLLAPTIPSNFHDKISNESKLWFGERLKDITNVLMDCCTEEALRDGRGLLVELLRAIPTERKAILDAVHEAITAQGNQLEAQLHAILETIDGAGQKSLLELLKEISGREGSPKRLLKSLETVQYLSNHLKRIDEQRKKEEPEKKEKPESKEEEKEATTESQQQRVNTTIVDDRADQESQLLMSMVGELKPLWDTLSKCLALLEHVEDSQHAVLCLQNAAEAFFLCYSLVIPPGQAGKTDPSGAPGSPSSAHQQQPSTSTTPSVDPKKYQNEMFAFAERHRAVLNQILRGHTHNLESSAFAILTYFPKLLDFDVKRKYFHKELKKMDERNRYRGEDIAIRVRRSHLFGDSFRELYRLRPQDWKARLYIMFEGEEGQDAGGLLREWYSVITREIFNPNYALFINAPGDRVTYMINKSSYVNPEHLDYFRFVGKVIAKAIYDNKQLDCYFTRAFYKHILNIHVRYQDIESEDPDLFKSLEFLLNNAVEDLGTELNFVVEVEEFGVRSTRQLKENGLKMVVTDANKQEYVQLMCQMKMTGSIRQQLSAFLEGFYEVIPKKLISIFNEQELELLISGLPEIDIDDLCVNTEYKTYTRTSPQIQWFWRALKTFDSEDKAKFLQFVTGTSKVPLQGFAHLEGMNGVQKFTIQKDTRSTDRLPSAHTCFNQLDLPEYPDYESLHKMLLLASRECSEGFAFA